MRIATWNLERQCGPDRLDLVRECNLDVLCGQEVTSAAYEAMVASGLFGWSVFSLDHRPRLLRASRSETLGCAVFGRAGIRLRASGILPWLTRPEKLAFAVVDLPGWKQPVTIASYHASPGEGKPEATMQVAHWLELLFEPALLGLDANSPKMDHPDPERSEFYWQEPPYERCEPALIGPPSKRRHGLEDCLRSWLTGNPSALEQITRERPNGPLAVSYDRHPAPDGYTPSRYDSLWASREFDVTSVEHRWDDGLRLPHGGSDHAMVIADLKHTASRPRREGEDIVDHLRRLEVIEDGTTFTFASDLLASENDHALVTGFIAEDERRGRAAWSNRGGPKTLVWEADGAVHTVSGLARAICAGAGAAMPARPAGPHWWVGPGGRNLVRISTDLGA